LLAATRKRPAGFLIVGVNPCRILDSDYRSFLELVAGHIARSIADAEAREGGRKRAEAPAEIDRTKTNVSHEALRRLPIESEAVAPVGDMADNSATVSRTPDGGMRARILVADGNPDMRAYLGQLLSPRWAVDAVADGQAALDAARHRKPDLVLADMMTPRLNGVQLLSALRSDHGLCDIPVILLCARAGEEEQVEGLRVGADGYVVKPFAARELIARIDTGLTLGRLRAAEMADLSRLHELSRRLTAPCDLASLLREVLDATIALQGADFGHIQLYDDQEEALEITAQRGFTQEFLDHFRRVHEFTDSSSGRALRQRQRVVIEDIAVDPLYAPLRPMAASAGFRAVQSTPLLARDGKQLVGMLSTHFRSVHRPTPRELRLLDLYARQAADVIAFRLAEQRLRESEERTHDDLTALAILHEVSTRSLQSPELQPVLETTLDAAISLAHGQRGNLQLLNDEKGVLEIAAHRGFKQPFLEFFREVHGELRAACGASMELGKAVVVHDVNASDIFKGTPSLAVLRHAGVRAVISVPLVARTGRFVGMTNVHFANPHRPDVRVMQRLELLGRQAADFIERMNILHHLRQSEARLQAAVHLVSLGLYAWNPQSNDLLWDDAMRAMWGLPAGSPVTYDAWLAGVHPEDRVRVEEAVRRCADAKGDGTYDIEYRVIGRTDGVERWIATRGQTTFENDRPISFYGVAQDVTDRKRTESKLQSRVEARTRELLDLNRHLSSQIEQRKIAEAALDKLQQLDAIGQITPGVAHDFNNLLSVVLTNARLLSRKSMESDDREGIELILAAAERGTKLTAQLLAFAGKQRLEPRIVDLNQKVAEMRDLLAATLGDTVQLRAHLHPQLWPALADPTQLEMIILNLAINGRDAMPSGGSVTIETFNTAIGDQPVRPEDPESGEYVGLGIRDTGEGIPEHVLARVFEPFFTTKRRGEGSGLGLAQVLGFAKQSGGGIRIETRVGEGTCVKVFLPRADVDPKVPNPLYSP
jgi:PAS domain S-box-containing protein